MAKHSNFSDSLIKFFTSVGYAGYSPFAPGTVGTFVAMAAYWLLPDLSPTCRLFVIAVLFIAGVPASSRAEIIYGENDCGRIVLDEFVGYWIAMMFLPPTPAYLIAGFVVFRFFDIIKPSPVRELERKYSGGMGIMIDDVAAGIYSNLALQVFRLAAT